MSHRTQTARRRVRRHLFQAGRLLLVLGIFSALLAVDPGHPAAAAGETLEVSVGQLDGTGPFDADSAAGHDANGTNGIVRTNDTITYQVEVAVQAANADAVTFTLVLPQGVELA